MDGDAANSASRHARPPLLRGPSSMASVDFASANDFFPVQVPLETAKICSWRYTARELDDLELNYDVESSDLLIRANVPGEGGVEPAVFRVRDISAADLSLVNIVPGSLESMVCRLTLETKSRITYSARTEPVDDSGKVAEEEEEEEEEELNCCIVTMTASVHESGHLRDILLFIRHGHGDLLSPESLFLSPRSHSGKSPTEDETTSASETDKSHVSFLSGLPFWVQYIPWWLYSKNVRVVIQRAIVVYTMFSVIWACWQLYRHVNVIHFVIEPFIAMLKLYLSSVMETFDAFLALFTDWWTTFLSPLNILRAMLVTPVFQLIAPLRALLYPMLSLLTPLKTAVTTLYGVIGLLGRLVWMLLSVLFRPLNYIWQTLLNSRVAVASLDLKIIRLRWVSSLLMGSLKSIGNGLANLIGYTHVKRKQRKARSLEHSSLAPSPKHGYRPRTMPVYYSSPLSKQS